MKQSRVYLAAVAACLVVLTLLSTESAQPKADDAKDKAAEKLFDPDPNHPWNRLHRFFYVRPLATGGVYAYHGPDAPLGRHGSFLIEGDSHKQALRLLDGFLKAKDDERVKDPVKRAAPARPVVCLR